MIPKEYQRLQLWLRLNNRVLVDMLKKTPAGEWWNKAYLRGGRHIVKQLARQWAYDVKQARRKRGMTKAELREKQDNFPRCKKCGGLLEMAKRVIPYEPAGGWFYEWICPIHGIMGRTDGPWKPDEGEGKR